MSLFGRDRSRGDTGRPTVRKRDDHDDLEHPNYPPCHPRNGGHDIRETGRTTTATGVTMVNGKCRKCGVETSERVGS